MDLLDLQKSMVYNVLKGEGFDSISRCRQLVAALKIHPPLLGLDAKYYPIEHHAQWWKSHGFPFNSDSLGYPVMSEVITYLRMQRTQIEGGRVKVWSQEDLGNATGLKKETVYRMEHNKNPLVLESMSRRAIVASALGTLAGEKESTIFRLLGLDPQAYRVPIPARESVSEVHFSPSKLTDEILKGYHRQQGALFTAYYTCHGEDAVVEALEWLRRFPTLMTLANTTAQRINLLALQCRYHELTVGVAREQRKTRVIAFHADKAVMLAEQAMTLHNPKLSEPTLFVITNELLAAALLWRAEASYEQGLYKTAQIDIDRALNLLPALQSRQLKIHIVADAGMIHAHTIVGEMDGTLVSSYFNLAEQMNVPSQSQPQSLTPDDNFILCGAGMLYLRKAMALSAPEMKGKTADNVLDVLETARQWTLPELIRRQTIIEVFQSQAHFNAGEYQQAAEVALLALEKSRLIRSHLNRDRIEGLYQQLLKTSFKDKPSLAYLGMRLRMWDHGMD
jgi:tetratricopeptide (TPR) repeat protein